MSPFAGWGGRGLAVVAGAAAALAHPPFGFLPGLLGYALLFALAEAPNDRPIRAAFFKGWLAGCAYFAISVWWVAEAFLVDVRAHGWMAPFAVFFLSAGLALFWGVAAALFRAIDARGVARLLVFAGALSLLEWTRGHILTGFPWNLPGETWRAGSAMSQAASIFGAYGLTWITLLIAAAPAMWRDGRAARGAIAACALILAGFWIWGAQRLAEPPPAGPAGPTVRIVQANIPQSDKYNTALFRSIVTRYVDLTRQPGPRADLVIWPEGAIPDAIDSYLAPGSWAYDQVMSALTPGQTLLVGGYRVEPASPRSRYYNAFVVVRRTADGLMLLGSYDKHRLVPFGEYMPLDNLLAPLGVRQLVQVGEGFTAGPPPRPLAIQGLPVMQPLICYESLFPGFTREGAHQAGIRPEVIVNVSNDAWFGATSGPLQHLNLASYRAIEEGLPLLRSTPTGVSAIVDASGRTVAGDSLSHGVTGLVEGHLPHRRSTTIYARTGELLFALLMSFSAFAAISGGNLVMRRILNNPLWGRRA